jgi:hypothetical protein
MEKNWKEIDKESEEFWEKQMQEAKKRSSADRDFFEAALSARQSVKDDNLIPFYNGQGIKRYSTQQGLKAACYAREDVAAIAIIQRSILKRLDSIKDLIWICAALLAYIAFRVS